MTTILALCGIVGGCGRSSNEKDGRGSNEKDGADTGNARGLVVIPPVPEHVRRMAEDASLNPATDAFYVSQDGSIVVGKSSQRTPGPAGPAAEVVTFRWTAATGSVDLTSGAAAPPGEIKLSAPFCVAPHGTSMVLRVNRDVYRWKESSGLVKLSFPSMVGDPALTDAACSVFVGTLQSSLGDGKTIERAVRWTESTGTVELGQIAGYTSTHATSVSRDGSVVFGSAFNETESEPFRWTQATGIVGLGRLPGSLECGRLSQGRIVADPDAKTLAGQCRTSSEPFSAGFVWTEDAGVRPTGAISNRVASSPTKVSADGSTVTGESIGVADHFAFRWTRTGIVQLGPLPGDTHSVPVGARIMSFDGGVVTCLSDRGPTPLAFRWSAATGATALKPLPGDVATDAVDVSPDGTTVVGASYMDPSSTVGTGVLWDQTGAVHRIVDEVPPEFEGTEPDRHVELIPLRSAQIADERGKILYGTAVLNAERGPALRAWVARLR
jgi:uncharacterized membrane protein